MSVFSITFTIAFGRYCKSICIENPKYIELVMPFGEFVHFCLYRYCRSCIIVIISQSLSDFRARRKASFPLCQNGLT